MDDLTRICIFVLYICIVDFPYMRYYFRLITNHDIVFQEKKKRTNDHSPGMTSWGDSYLIGLGIRVHPFPSTKSK